MYAKFYQNIPKVQKIEPVSLFSEFEPRQNLDQSQMTFDILMGYILSISMCMQKFITIFHSVQEIGPFSLFQNLELGKASTDEKCHFAISSDRSCQYQWLCKNLSKYSKWFNSYRHSSRTVRRQNLHKRAGDKIFTNGPVTKSNV